MKDKILSFVAGVSTTVVIGLGVVFYSHEPNIQYHYYYHEARQKMIELLENKGVLFTYEIDHLKRHWIKPWVNDLKDLESIELEFSNWETNHSSE